ncbi:lysophosphatidic acid receptor 6-like [Pristis pectinata]|uniref:lysophosphatidic acid receptor 6-like n=1 Tax=Pristis pectinata TaxID=685728 RepID=UPI00223D2370|nr:lysophosphatidic acid receptor 6-like [Pristis pectinata]
MENGSKDSNDTILYVNTLFASVYGLTVVVGLPLNSISLWVFSIKLKLQTAPVIYLTNLAVSDLLFILALPFRVYYFATTRWPFGNLVCTMSETIFSVNIYTSTLLITLISIDRYLAVVHPLKSNFLRSPKAANIACAIAWFIIISMSFPIAFQYHQKDTKNGTKCYEGFSTESWQSALKLILLITTLGFAVPFVIIIGCFFAVVRVMLQIRKESQAFKRYKIIPLFLLNIGVFIMCFLPFNVALVSYGLHKVGYFSMEGSYLVHAVTMCLASISSCTDPIVYYFTSKAFRNVAMKDAKDTSQCNTFNKKRTSD